LLDSKEAEADSEKRLNVLNALSNTSELSGHKVEQYKWLQQLLDSRLQRYEIFRNKVTLFQKKDISL
jgi:hypothetical protein